MPLSLTVHVAVFLGAAFAGYVIGRLGHVLFGHLYAPHHWVYGVLLIIAVFFFPRRFWQLIAGGLGVGLVISDAADLLAGRFIGRDETEEKQFWGFD